MACRQETLDLNGDKYLVFQLPPSEALPLKFKLLKILGPSLAELLQGEQDQKESGKGIIDALSKLFTDCDPDEFTEIIKSVVCRVRKNGKHVSFDEDFQDDYKTLYHVFFWVLKVNYANFFKGLNVGEDLKSLVA